MTDMLYEKQGSYLQGKAEGRKEERQLAETKELESARNLIGLGVPKDVVIQSMHLSEDQIKAL